MAKKTLSEIPLVASLVRFFWPDCTDEFVADALSARGRDFEDELRETSPVFDPQYKDLFETQDNFESDEIREQYKMHEKARQKKQQNDKHRTTLLR